MRIAIQELGNHHPSPLHVSVLTSTLDICPLVSGSLSCSCSHGCQDYQDGSEAGKGLADS